MSNRGCSRACGERAGRTPRAFEGSRNPRPRLIEGFPPGRPLPARARGGAGRRSVRRGHRRDRRLLHSARLAAAEHMGFAPPDSDRVRPSDRGRPSRPRAIPHGVLRDWMSQPGDDSAPRVRPSNSASPPRLRNTRPPRRAASSANRRRDARFGRSGGSGGAPAGNDSNVPRARLGVSGRSRARLRGTNRVRPANRRNSARSAMSKRGTHIRGAPDEADRESVNPRQGKPTRLSQRAESRQRPRPNRRPRATDDLHRSGPPPPVPRVVCIPNHRFARSMSSRPATRIRRHLSGRRTAFTAGTEARTPRLSGTGARIWYTTAYNFPLSAPRPMP